DRTWAVPLVIRHDGETTSALLTERSMLLTGITGTPTTVNAGAAGFFRTAIDEAILAELEANGPGDRTPTERHGLVDDAWALTVAGSLSAVDFLRLARALAGEDDLNVWQALATGLHGLDRLVEGSAADVLAGTIRELAGPALASIGFEPGAGDDDRTLELRATLVRLLGTAGNDAEVIAAAKGAVDHAEASLGAAALTVVAHHGGQAEYDTIRATWLDATDPVTEIRNQRALAGFRSVELVPVHSGVERSPDGFGISSPPIGTILTNASRRTRSHACCPGSRLSTNPTSSRRSRPSSTTTRSRRPESRSTNTSNVSASTPHSGPERPSG
ncbi:MAG: hypothetical protein EBZ17_04285, partial [Actinobacteria bacterium]|nr:hypothetical protein [Actinomycetota bacterium]